MRITYILMLLVLSTVAIANENQKQIYLEYESAYMSNDADRFSEWLSQEYTIKQTLHIPGVGPDYRPVTKEQLVAGMRKVGRPSSFPRSDSANVSIEQKGEMEFCGRSSTKTQTKVRGKDYEEKEKRKVCFRKEGGKYLAIEHTIDVYFIEM